MISYKQLRDFDIHATDGDIGGCKDVLFDDQDFVVRYLVVDTNNWLPLSRKVVISPISIARVARDEEKIHVNMTSQALKDSPSIDEHKPLSREYEETLFKYFGYGYYWIGPGAWGDFTHPTELADQEMQESLNELSEKPSNHLRSCSEVHGYEVSTQDDEIGHITDFLIDPESWSLKLLVVDTRNWLPGGKKLAVRPADLEKIDWSSHKVVFKLSHDQLMARPEVDMDKLQDESYVQSMLLKAE
ncbi:PRC-barrel domain-containing protein [Alteromonas pelagimontana]|uniref:PRC-barrel domain-containing protein n=1 Tax=Alteromonas pelagimontana TaxID=1858656 RepID=A0A6M4MGW9_9ALTE|nr:PRC-barrel domain-containing protein [Alteromonas pelagimontana]QJR82323.1 PRC-barrel domain-containing protein [Alteromonas pelagimontana]